MCRDNKCVIPLIISIIIGTIIGTLVFIGTIATEIIETPIIFATIFAGISLALLYIGATFSTKRETKECICEYGKCLIIGTSGTLFVGFLALTLIASLVAGSVLTAILLGLGGFLFVFNALIFLEFVICLINSNCCKKDSFYKYDNN